MWEERWFCSSLLTKVGVKGGVLFTLLLKIVIAYERTLTNWLTAQRGISLNLLGPNYNSLKIFFLPLPHQRLWIYSSVDVQSFCYSLVSHIRSWQWVILGHLHRMGRGAHCSEQFGKLVLLLQRKAPACTDLAIKHELCDPFRVKKLLEVA